MTRRIRRKNEYREIETEHSFSIIRVHKTNKTRLKRGINSPFIFLFSCLGSEIGAELLLSPKFKFHS